MFVKQSRNSLMEMEDIWIMYIFILLEITSASYCEVIFASTSINIEFGVHERNLPAMTCTSVVTWSTVGTI